MFAATGRKFERIRYTEIFNADETELLYKMTPDKTLRVKEEKCSGWKMSKERSTVLVTVNLAGSFKSKLVVIGK